MEYLSQPSLVAFHLSARAKPTSRDEILVETIRQSAAYHDVRKLVHAVNARPSPGTDPGEGVHVRKAVFTPARANEVVAVLQAGLQNWKDPGGLMSQSKYQ